MPALNELEQYVWWLAIFGHVVLAVRIWRSGLRRTYRFFFGYLIFRVARFVVLEAIPDLFRFLDKRPEVPFGTNAYAWAWLLSQPVVWFFYVLIVLELYSLVLQNYKGIASLSRWVLLAGLLVSILISSLTLPTDFSNTGEQFPVLRYAFAVNRGVVSSLVIFLLFITGFLVWYPVPLSRNVVVHCVVYAIYFLSISLVVLLRNITGSEVTQTANIILSSVTAACLTVWIALLSRQGEAVKVRIRRHWAAEEEEQLVQQLAVINSTLLRAARK